MRDLVSRRDVDGGREDGPVEGDREVEDEDDPRQVSQEREERVEDEQDYLVGEEALGEGFDSSFASNMSDLVSRGDVDGGKEDGPVEGDREDEDDPRQFSREREERVEDEQEYLVGEAVLGEGFDEKEQEEDEKPWKRLYQQVQEVRDDCDGACSDSSNKRRRLSPGLEFASQELYRLIPAAPGQWRAHVEFGGATAFTVFFTVLNYNRFALAWASAIFVGHGLQTAFTDFEGGRSSKKKAASLQQQGQKKNGGFFSFPHIQGRTHLTLDIYIWSHPLTSTMLWAPRLFQDEGAKVVVPPYWMACFFVVCQMFVVAKFHKEEYLLYYEPLIRNNLALQKQIQVGFTDTFVCYGLALLFLVLARLLGGGGSMTETSLLTMGLLIFNISPMYMFYISDHRFDYVAATQFRSIDSIATQKRKRREETKDRYRSQKKP